MGDLASFPIDYRELLSFLSIPCYGGSAAPPSAHFLPRPPFRPSKDHLNSRASPFLVRMLSDSKEELWEPFRSCFSLCPCFCPRISLAKSEASMRVRFSFYRSFFFSRSFGTLRNRPDRYEIFVARFDYIYIQGGLFLSRLCALMSCITGRPPPHSFLVGWRREASLLFKAFTLSFPSAILFFSFRGMSSFSKGPIWAKFFLSFSDEALL